jgi:predicted metal-dependent hydrolase
MKRKIFIKDRELIYDLSLKNIKNINMRIHNDGKIFLSAPLNVSSDIVESFIILREDWIIKHLDRINVASKYHSIELKNGEGIPIFDKKYILNIQKSKTKASYIEDDKLTILLPEPTNKKQIQNLLSSFLEDILKENLYIMCSDIYERNFRSFNVSYPEIQIRKMKARWGSCHSQKSKLIFNKQLVFLPKKCIEYIIYHEFTHFIHPNHSPDFYRTLKGFLPDFCERKNELKKYNNNINFIF